MKNKLFIGIFFLISILPLALMVVPSGADQVANEVLTEPPALFVDGTINVNYPSQFSDYFDDNFGLRKQMISLHNRLVAAVFRESAEKKVIFGKDGWLFYEETLDDYQSTNAFSKQELNNVCTTLSLMQEYCQENGMKFLFTIAPNKSSLYGEMMPDYYMKNQETSNGTILSKMLSNSDITYLDLFQAFRQEEKPLYRRSDSHWTQEGAGLAADRIANALQMNAEPFYGSATRVEKAPVGDLYEMLFLSEQDTDLDVLYERTPKFEYARPIRSVEDNFIRTTSTNGKGRLFMFRDSFGNNLHPLMAERFANATFCRLNPYNLTLAKMERADTVVIELVERNLEWLLSKPPVFPAPQRDARMDALENVTAEVAVSLEAVEDIMGYHKIQGKLPQDIGYEKIYLLVNGKLYQATPSSDGFVGFLPTEEVSGGCSVYLEKE